MTTTTTSPAQSASPREMKAHSIASPTLCHAMLMTLLNDKDHIEKHPIYVYPESKKTAIIVDPRYDDVMKAVIYNFMFFMNPHGWNLSIMSYSGYEDVIKRDFPQCRFAPIDESMVRIDETGVPHITIDQYNTILTSASFWQNQTEHVALFQKDCIMFRMFPSYFQEYDYAGANYYGASSPMYGGINGGFSLRRRTAMLDCIEHVSYDRIYKYNPRLETDPHRTNEDVFFTHACEILNKTVPDKIHRTVLAIENDYNIDTSVFHGWDKYTKHTEFIADVLAKSPLFSRYIQLKE